MWEFKQTKEEKRKHKKSLWQVVKMLARTMAIFMKSVPVLSAIEILLSLTFGVSLAITPFLNQKFFDSVTKIVSDKSVFPTLIFWLIMIGIISTFNPIIDAIQDYVDEVTTKKADSILIKSINKKMGKISPIEFEDTKKLDVINKTFAGKGAVVGTARNLICMIFFTVPYFLVMGIYLYSLKPILFIMIILASIPIIIMQILRSKIYGFLEDQTAPIRRENEYYKRAIVDREFFKETRLLGGFMYFNKLFKDTLKNINNLAFKINVKNNIIELFFKVSTAGCYAVVLYVLFKSVIKGEISVGAFAAVFASIGIIFDIMRQLFFYRMRWLSYDIGVINFYLDFLDMPTRGGEDFDIDPKADIVLKNVTFSYPNAETFAVKNANFTLKSGETIAIVGENGSGKSTIVRLITGLYLPSSGEVLIDGKATTEISMKSLFKNTTATFQKYQRYQMKLCDNLEISETAKEKNKKTLDNATEKAGIDASGGNFPDGYETMLSREYDGVDLSGGQWQRVAIARGFYREHNLIVLDEPTAAIDPFEEAKIYNKFAENSKEKTAIIVTHRLGSVKLADRIMVMANGEVVGVGTHEQLIREGGEYKRLWESQEQWYI